MTASVLIVEDHPLFRAALIHLVQVRAVLILDSPVFPGRQVHTGRYVLVGEYCW